MRPVTISTYDKYLFFNARHTQVETKLALRHTNVPSKPTLSWLGSAVGGSGRGFMYAITTRREGGLEAPRARTSR